MASSLDVYGGQDGDSAAKVANALKFWKEFDLDDKRTMLDKKSLEMADNQDKSLRSRKKLAEATKSFRKSSDDAKVKAISSLLRQYQEEVDKLTKRSKFAEGGFLMLYKALYDAPNPVQALELSAANLSSSGDSKYKREVEKLTAEIAEYEAEFVTLTNQDITIRKLEGEIEDLQASIEAKVQEAVKDKEKTLMEHIAQHRQEEEETQQDFSTEIVSLQNTLQECQTLYDEAQDQIMELRLALEEKETASGTAQTLEDEAADGMDLLERECQNLRDQLASAKEDLTREYNLTLERDRTRILALEDDLKKKQASIDTYRAEKAKVGFDSESLKTEFTKQLEGRDLTIRNLKEHVEELERENRARPTVHELERVQTKLHVYQAIEYSVSSHDDQALKNMSDAEKAMFARVRKLESSLSSLRVQLDQVTEGKASLQRHLDTERTNSVLQAEMIEKLETENMNLESVVATLRTKAHEQGLANINSQNNSAAAPNQVAGSPMSPQSSQLLKQVLSDDPAAATDAKVPTLAKYDSSWSQQEPQDASSMLHILHEQRDRFRKRMLELESEKKNQELRVQQFQRVAEQVKVDNVKLYEKIKYLQSKAYTTKQAPSHVVTPRLNQNQMLEARFGDNDVEARYKDLYEDKMNPFRDFEMRERRKRYTGLSTAEKITLSSTRFFMANKYTRSFVFFYAVALHLLVFFITWYMAHKSTTKCPHATAQHHHMLSAGVAGAPPGN